MIVSIHQPHYFPWMGYFDKMAKADTFILLDDVQLEKGSYMYRNRILNPQGKISYLTISGDKHGFLDRSYREIASTNDDVWLEKHAAELKRSYGESAFFEEVWDKIGDLFSKKEETIAAYCIRSVLRLREILEIPTKILLQSDLPSDDTKRKNDLVLSLCKTAGADGYLSGNGARKYTDESSFENAGIRLRYQTFQPPVYDQMHTEEFVPGLSMLDVLFNCGTEKTKELFREASRAGKEIEE